MAEPRCGSRTGEKAAGVGAAGYAGGVAWYVYVVRCGDGSLYTGISVDVAARVRAHNEGRGARYTRSRLPVGLVHTERKRSRSTAQSREAAIKALSRQDKLKLIAAWTAARSTRATPAPAPRVRRPPGLRT